MMAAQWRDRSQVYTSPPLSHVTRRYRYSRARKPSASLTPARRTCSSTVAALKNSIFLDEAVMTITLYNTKGSPPCTFVRVVAKKAGVALNLREIDIMAKEQLKPEFLKVSVEEGRQIVITRHDNWGTAAVVSDSPPFHVRRHQEKQRYTAHESRG